jgi:ABC-type multidrug transport system ATPase subunit
MLYGPLTADQDRPTAAEPMPDSAVAAAPLVLDGVSKRWRGAPASVLHDVGLTLTAGSATWVGGRNGAGKTTMLRIAAGLIEPDRGRVEVRGVSPIENRARYQRLVAFLPAGDRGLYARLSVRRHLEFWARLSMVARDRVGRRVENAITTFALGELADRRVDRMSMGQRQRLRLAMTFLPHPDVVLLDEPLTSLDEEGTSLLEAAVEEVLASGGATLWCSPSEERVTLTFNARLRIDNGQLGAA